jgi:hypothetical protein
MAISLFRRKMIELFAGLRVWNDKKNPVKKDHRQDENKAYHAT